MLFTERGELNVPVGILRGEDCSQKGSGDYSLEVVMTVTVVMEMKMLMTKVTKLQQQENEDGDDGDNGRSCVKEISKVAKCNSVKMKIFKKKKKNVAANVCARISFEKEKNSPAS